MWKMWKCIVPYFISYLYCIRLLFKICNIKSILKQQPACRLESHILLVQQCHGGWNLVPSFWTWIQVAVNEMGPYNILKEGEIQEFTVSWQNLGHILEVEEVVFLNFLPSAYRDNSEVWPLYWNIKTLECLPSLSLSHKKNVSSVAPPWQHSRVSTSTLQFWPCTSRLLSISSFKKGGWGCWGLQGHHYASNNALQSTMCQWLQRVENNFYQAGIQRWKKTVGKCGETNSGQSKISEHILEENHFFMSMENINIISEIKNKFNWTQLKNSVFIKQPNLVSSWMKRI